MADEKAEKPGDSAVRTTVTLPREVYRRVRIIAGARETTAIQVMADAISEWTQAEMTNLGFAG